MNKGKSVKKSWIFGGAIILVATAGVVYGVTRPVSVPVGEVSPKDVKLFFTEEGFVKDETTVDVYSLHSGAVTALYVKEGQQVSEGEPLCQIDASRLQHELETARSGQKGQLSQINDLDLQEKQMKDELRVSRNKLRGEFQTMAAEESSASQTYLSAGITKEEQINLQNVIIEQNRADLQNARDNLEKSEMLYAAGAVSKQEADDNASAVSRLESVLEQNMGQLEIIRSSNETQSREAYFKSAKAAITEQISAIDAQLGNTYTQAMKEYYQSQIESGDASILLLEKQIEECTVKAPAAGVITELNVDKSNVVMAEVPIAAMSVGFEPLIEVYVPTSEIGSVHLNDTVELELKSEEGSVYRGIVTEIDNKAVIQASSLGVEKRKVKVTIRPVDEHLSYFKPGYDLIVSFTTYQEDGLLTVPRTAVTYMDDKTFVWVVVDGKAAHREVEIERELKTEYVVRSGLSEGEQVIKDATVPELENGKSVHVIIS